MSDSAIERLKNRQRKKVAVRDASLNQSSQPAIELNNNDLLTEASQLAIESNNNDLLTETSQLAIESNNNDLLTETNQPAIEPNNNDLLTETSQLAIESNNNDLLTETSQSILSVDTEPVRRSMRLDPNIDAYMDTLCKKNKITKETLLEAAIVVCSSNQKTLSKVIADAQKRYSNRKRIGELKKYETMSRKFQKSSS
jgi:hypothetical protein